MGCSSSVVHRNAYDLHNSIAHTDGNTQVIKPLKHITQITTPPSNKRGNPNMQVHVIKNIEGIKTLGQNNLGN